ncbi:MAG: accessory gene regulator B family protein [Lachnospiraceae bacterium]|nr:accessory gene regulator B family protein [Lachnospiraceae bacterium]
MIEQVAENICDNVEEKEIVHFGLERLKVAVVAMVLIIITGVLLHEIWRSILLVVCLLPLRQNAGGYHMRSSRTCAIFSYVVLVLLILCVKFVVFDSWIHVLIWSGCFALILLLSPVGTENHRLDVDEKKVYGRRARIICYIESALFLILVYLGKSYWYKVILTAEIVTAILLIAGKIQEKMIGRKGACDV